MVEVALPLRHGLQAVEKRSIVAEIEDAKVQANAVEDIHAQACIPPPLWMGVVAIVDKGLLVLLGCVVGHGCCDMTTGVVVSQTNNGVVRCGSIRDMGADGCDDRLINGKSLVGQNGVGKQREWKCVPLTK